MSSVLAINIGGTTTKWARFDVTPSGRVEGRRLSTPRTREGFRSLLIDIAGEFESAPARVSIGFPGPVEADGRLSNACTWMPGQDMSDFDLRSEVRRVWRRADTWVINDVSAYGRFLLHEGYRDFCVLNVGSGVGAKVYADGRELLGPGSRGGELGHVVDFMVPKALPCDCGGLQHIGGMSSGRGVLRYARLVATRDPARYAGSQLARLVPDPAALTEAHVVAYAGDPFVSAVLEDAMRPLARAATLIHLAIGCESFVLVGGFAEALGARLSDLLAQLSAAMGWDNGFDWHGAYRVLQDEVSASLIGLYWQGEQDGTRAGRLAG